MNLIFRLLLLIFVLSACTNYSANEIDQNKIGKIIGLTQGLGITFNKLFDGSALSISYDQASIHYEPDEVNAKEKRHRNSKTFNFTVLGNEAQLPIRLFIRGYFKGSDIDQAKILFSIGNKDITIPLELNDTKIFGCIDGVLPDRETLIEWKMELIEFTDEPISISLDSIDIVVIGSLANKECGQEKG